jgi:hypothetical protein
MYEHLHRQLGRSVVWRRTAWKKTAAYIVHHRLRPYKPSPLICTGCHGDFEADPGPVLYDKVWRRIAEHREMLCHKCVCKRINLHVFYHCKNVPWNVDFSDPYIMTRLGPTGRCWWRGPNEYRLRVYGTYIYDQAAMVRVTTRYTAALVAGDGHWHEPADA